MIHWAFRDLLHIQNLATINFSTDVIYQGFRIDANLNSFSNNVAPVFDVCKEACRSLFSSAWALRKSHPLKNHWLFVHYIKLDVLVSIFIAETETICRIGGFP